LREITYFVVMKRFLYIFLLTLLIRTPVSGQAVYQYLADRNIYGFLDELASEKVIALNSAIKPYTRAFIYQKLSEAQQHREQLNNRQTSELEHYLDYYTFGNVFNYLPVETHGRASLLNLFPNSSRSATSLNHLGFFYSDSMFSFSLRPILGLEYYSNAAGDYTHTYGGLEAFASITRYLSFYASLRDNTVSEVLNQPEYFTDEPAGAYKGSNTGAADYSEMRGGIMLSWDFLQVGFVKDHLTWGNGFHGSIIQSGNTPSFPMIRLHIQPAKWFDFNYYHAWLTSDVVDSSLSYILPNGLHRDTYKNKFIAANMFTVTPVKGLNISFGNSIIYSDQNVNLAYLIPIFFYKSVDHTQSYKISNQNSQMFFDISTRLIKHTHVFFSLFVDEFSTTRISDPGTHNFYGYKLGGKISNWPLRNVSIAGEYYRSVPVIYKHYIPTITYESNSYSMGAYLRDNSTETYLALDWKPLPRAFVRYTFTHARHGNEYEYYDGNSAVETPILQDNTWTNISHSMMASVELLTGCYVSVEYRMSDIKGHDADGQLAEVYLNRYTPEFFRGRRNTVLVKINVGF
jgi:hypothetical protein